MSLMNPLNFISSPFRLKEKQRYGIIHSNHHNCEDLPLNIPLLIISAVCIAAVIILGALINWHSSVLQTVTLGCADKRLKWIAVLSAVLISLSCALPMGLSPVYNGELQDHLNQYELITEAFLSGHLDFQYDWIDERLLAMENPYDAQARADLGVYYHWDHAFYDGHYYMYFGVVPVFLAFMPYRLITGQALTGYHVTQIFSAIFIAGIFSLLWTLGRKYFKKMPFALYLLICSAISYLSVWNAVATPALYSMCIICALALAVWSVYLFVKAVLFTENENRAIALAALASLLGALEFGCRPTVGLSNLIVLPLLYIFLKKHRISAKLIGKLVLAALPYVLVAAGLMWYNNARFDSPFEFGQSYQLTVTDQSNYGNMLDQFSPSALAHCLYYYLLNVSNPTILPSLGLLISFPILLAGFVLLCSQKNRRTLGETKLASLFSFLLITVFVIILFESLWAPHPTPRYRMDFAWLLGIAAFIMAGCTCETCRDSLKPSRLLGTLCLLTLIISVLLALYPQNKNFTEYYFADIKAMLGLK